MNYGCGGIGVEHVGDREEVGIRNNAYRGWYIIIIM